jgi:hypothetical protein
MIKTSAWNAPYVGSAAPNLSHYAPLSGTRQQADEAIKNGPDGGLR